jgi:hypothetical protein
MSTIATTANFLRLLQEDLNQIPQPQMAQAGRKNVWAVVVHE